MHSNNLPTKLPKRHKWLIDCLAGLNYDPSQPWTAYPCLDWPFGLDTNGYGQVRMPVDLGGKMRLVSRATMEHVTNSPLDKSICALHYCDRPICFHPAHLYMGSVIDNILDMVRKGRSRGVKGERNNKAKMTWETVHLARQMRSHGATIEELAKHFGLAQSSTRSMLIGDTWKPE